MRLRTAHHELAEAQSVASADPSDVNIARLQRAMDEVAFWQAMGRVGQVGTAAYAVTATKSLRHYPRPELQRAERRWRA